MNKKIKWAIPFAVLALSCGIAAGCGGKHEHSYTEWGYNTTQHWKQCPEDDEIDESSKKAHNFIGGSCECGATQQTPPVTDVTITNGTTDTNGTVTLSKTTVKTGESVTVTVEPKAGYQLKSLTVNGANVFGAMTGNTYEFTVSENTTVVAVFEKIASSSVNSVISGKKYGVTGNSLTAGTDVTLSAEGRDDVATKIKADGDNLVIKVDEIAGDNWAVKVEGYVAATIVVPRDAAYTSAIALEYDLMENLSTSWGNYDGVDLSKQNDGKITHVGGGYYQWVSSKDSYESVAITAKVVKGGFRQGVFIRFKGDTYADDGFVMVAKENQQKISVCGAGDGYTGKNLWKDNWDEYLNPLAKDEYELTLVRNGADIYIFIDGEYTATKALPEGYADKECYVGLFCTDATKMENSERTFSIGTYDDFFKTVTITDTTETGAKGSVTLPTGEHKVGEQVEITVTPDSGYVVGSFTVNGTEYADRIANGKVTVTLTKATIEVKATFVESAFTASNKECPQGTYDFDSYIVNDKLVLGYKRYNAAGDAPSYGGLIGNGLDGITRYGDDFNGTIGNINFKANGTTNSNCLFLDNGQYIDVTVKVPKNAKQILVFTGTYDGGDKTITCNLYNADGHCVGNGTFLHTRGDNPRADLVTFDVDTTEFGADGETFTLRIGGNCSTTVAAIAVLGEKHDVTITDGTTDTNGTVTITGTTENKITTGGMVTVALEPNSGYRIKDIKVNGQSVLASVVNNVYTFVAIQDATVVAEFEQLQLVDVTLTLNAEDFAGNSAALAVGTTVRFEDVNGYVTYDYTVGGTGNFTQMYAGTYIVTCDGYFEKTIIVEADNGEITVNFSEPIATPSENDTKNEIAVNEDKTITIHGNGATDRDGGNRKINAEYKMTEEQKNSTGFTLTFTAKATMKDGRGGSDWAASRFGVQICEGEIGFMVFPRYNSSATAADVAKFIPGTNLSLNPDKDNKGEQKWHGDDPDLAWLAAALYSENGVQFRVTRANGVITIEAKNGENWVALDTMGTKGETATANDIGKLTVGNAVKNQIKFTAGGDHWTFSDISVTLPAESEKATLTTSVNDKALGNIETDVANYYKGDKAILTVTVNQGYVLEKLVIGETEVLANECTKNGLEYTYEYTLTGDTTVVAYIIETPTPQVTPNVTVSGGKYGSTETPTVAAGTTVTLTNAEMETEYVGTVGTDGKLTFDKELYVATYKVSAEGYFDGEITITENVTEPIELKLYVETVDCEIMVGETGDTAKFVAEGATITFSLNGETKEVTVTDGKVKLENVLTGDWKTTANFGGYDLHLGWTTVGKSGTASVTVDAAGICWFGDRPYQHDFAGVDINGATIEVKTDKAYHNRLKLATAKEGGAMAFKFALPADVKTKLESGDGKAAVTMPIGNGSASLWVVFAMEKSGANKTIKFAYHDKVSDGGWFADDGAKRLDLSSYWDTLVSDGLWVVVDVNAKSAAICTYVGATLETALNAKYDRTCTLAPLSFNQIEIGNALGDWTGENVCVTFKYGETLTALNVGKNVTLAEVDAEVTVGGTDNKYTAEGATLVFNHINGLYSVEGKVTNSKVSLNNIPVGEYKVGAKVNGLIVDLGSITVADGDANKTIALEAKPVFDPKKEQNYAGYDLAEGSFEIITNATYHNKIEFAQAGNGGALALKFALPAGTDASGDFKAVTSMPLNFADGSMWIVLRLEKSGDNKIAKFGFTSVDGGEYWGKDGDGYLDLSEQWDTIVSGGLWVVVDIDAANGAIKTYTGASLDTVQDANFNRTCRSGNRIITALEIGNAIESTDTNFCITLAYGETLDEVKALGGKLQN